MDGLILGVDLCDAYTQISCMEGEKTWTLPTVICRHKQEDIWFVGEEAYRSALVGEGILVDKLYKLAKKDGTSTIGGVKFQGLELISRFLKSILEYPKEEYGKSQIAQIVFTLEEVDEKAMEILFHCASYLEIPRERTHIISRTEAFLYYVVNQQRELWNNQVGMFDLSEDSFSYYEMKVQRGLRQATIIAEREGLEEGFNLDILNNPSGKKLADKILCSCGERLLQNKMFSSVLLTGKGFESQAWATEFMKLVCSKKRVYADLNVFSQGACYKSADYMQEKTSYPFVMVCEGRLDSTVSMNVIHNNKEGQLVMAAAGDSWFETKGTVDVILDNQKEIEFYITPLDPKKKKLVKIPLEGFPDRPNKTTRISVSISFLDSRTMSAVIKDKGFGELYQASDAVLRQEVRL